MHLLHLNANCVCFSDEEPVFIHRLLGFLNEYLSHSFHTFFFFWSWRKTITNSRHCTFVCEWCLALTAGVMQLSSIAQRDNRRGGGIHKFWQDSLDFSTPPELTTYQRDPAEGEGAGTKCPVRVSSYLYSVKYTVISCCLPLITCFSAFSFSMAQWSKTHPTLPNSPNFESQTSSSLTLGWKMAAVWPSKVWWS